MGYLSGSLDLGRLAIIEGLRSIPLVTPKYLLEYVLPRLPSTFNFDRLQADLRAKSFFRTTGWEHFVTPPKTTSGHESKVFLPLVQIFNTIVKSAKKQNISPVLRMRHNPSAAPFSQRANSSRPDGILELILSNRVETRVNDSDWQDIPVSMEFKKSDGAVAEHDNQAKIIWSLHHMMRNDPRRRFAFGITIENTTMRIWFSCRSILLASTPFDLFKEHDIVIRLFVSLAFGTPTQLGYDPTVKQVLDNGKVQYEYGVGKKNYRTVAVLSDFGADPLLGRGTRVFQVYDTSDPRKTPRALKDSWVETDRRREGDVLDDLFAKIGSTGKAADVETARKYFLTTLCHGDVVVNGRNDHTNDLLGGEHLPAEFDDMDIPVNLFRQAHASGHSQRASIGFVPGAEVNPFERMHPRRTKRISIRAHYRIVFSEVGTMVQDLTSLSTVFQALHDTVEGLRIMHAHGYVHRDVSTGNILLCNGGGKIADLEYAKEVATGTAPHEVRIGTVYFIALEVESQSYIFKSNSDDLGELMGSVNDMTTKLRDVNVTPFTYNPLHDLESIWWITNFFVFYNSTIAGTHDRQILDGDVAKLFPTGNDASRLLAFSFGQYKAMTLHLPHELLIHGAILEFCRRVLVKMYQRAESKPNISEAAFDETVHETFKAVFKRLRDNPGSHAASVYVPKLNSDDKKRYLEETHEGNEIGSSEATKKQKKAD